MKIDRRVLINFDWILPMLVLLLCGIGLVNLYSAGSNIDYGNVTPHYVRQLYWIGLGLVMMVVAFSIDYRLMVRYGYVLYTLSLMLLLVLFVCGEVTHGSQRWLTLGGFTMQPSELIKLTMIIALVKYVDDRYEGTSFGLSDLFTPFLLLLVPALLILKQPDLGTAFFLVLLFLSFVLFAGIRMKAFLFLCASSLALLPGLWFVMKDYQKERLVMFLNPEHDPLGAGYHIIQSIIAVGSGGLIGKGYLKGTQSQLKFLPEQQTDFVFSVFAEEWGFIGVIVVLVIFLSLILWGLNVARRARDYSGLLVAYGATMIFFFFLFINIGMILGILPVVGIPLPFMSYGGSSMVVLMMAAGLIMNVSMRRFVLQP